MHCEYISRRIAYKLSRARPVLWVKDKSKPFSGMSFFGLSKRCENIECNGAVSGHSIVLSVTSIDSAPSTASRLNSGSGSPMFKDCSAIMASGLFSTTFSTGELSWASADLLRSAASFSRALLSARRFSCNLRCALRDCAALCWARGESIHEPKLQLLLKVKSKKGKRIMGGVHVRVVA